MGKFGWFALGYTAAFLLDDAVKSYIARKKGV